MLILAFLTGILATCAIDPAFTRSSVDRTYEPGPQGCRAINRAEVISSKCPARDAACQRAECRDGMFSVTVQRAMTNVGSYDQRQISIDLTYGDLLLAPRVDTLLDIDGRETAISPVQLGTPLSSGASEDRLAVRFFVNTAVAERATESLKIPLVKDRIVARAPLQTGRVDGEPQSIAPRTLPVMDGALSSLVWCAVITLLLAAAVALSRGLH